MRIYSNIYFVTEQMINSCALLLNTIDRWIRCETLPRGMHRISNDQNVHLKVLKNANLIKKALKHALG